MMASQLRYVLIGDSNVRRNINDVNRRACPPLSSTKFIPCTSFSVFDECLSKVSADHDVLLVSCITNFLVDADEVTSAGKRVEPVIVEFRELLASLSQTLPSCSILVAPPMYRTHPVWYRDGLPEILTKFSSCMSVGDSRLCLLPSFATPEFEADGIHLTSYSGLEFILHLFDSAAAAAALSDADVECDEKFKKSIESSRLLEDRMVAIEQDHRRLSRDVEYRAAVDAELHDFHENSGFEDFFIITGQLSKPDSGLSGPDWQREVIQIIQGYVKLVIGGEADIKYVQNITGRSRDSLVRYQVKTGSVAQSREIRSKFGFFFAKGSDSRPPLLKSADVAIRNRVTQDTRVRIAVLQVLAKRYQESNKGSKAHVVTFEPRPVLRITPPEGVSDRRTKSFNYVEAVKKFPTNFSDKELKHILPKISSRQFGRLKSVFICLSDDLQRPSRESDGTSAEVNESSGNKSRQKRGRSPSTADHRPDKNSRR